MYVKLWQGTSSAWHCNAGKAGYGSYAGGGPTRDEAREKALRVLVRWGVPAAEILAHYRESVGPLAAALFDWTDWG